MTRRRTKGALTPGPLVQTQQLNQNCSNTTWQTIASNPSFHEGEFRSFADEVIPRFHERRKKGEVFFNPATSLRIFAESMPGDGAWVEKVGNTINCSGQIRQIANRDEGRWSDRVYAALVNYSFPASGPWLPPERQLLDATALSDLLVEASTSALNKRGRNDYNLWETLAESNKALGTLTGIFKGAAGTFGGLAKGKALSASKDASSGYLAYRYGLKPLISDVQSVLEGLEKSVGKMRKTSRASVPWTRYEQRNLVYNGSDSHACTVFEQCWDEGTVRAMALDEILRTEAYNLGLTTKGLLTLPWELVRYSFVLDWFVNLGDYIGAITPAVGWTNLGSCIAIKRRTSMLYQISSDQPKAGWNLVRGASGGYRIHRESYTRTAGLKQPGVVVKSDFRFDNAQRCLDALTLLVQRAVPAIKGIRK